MNSETNTMQSSQPTDLSAAAVERAIQLRFGHQRSLHCIRAHQGSEYSVWYAGSDHVFRAVPNTQDSVIALKRDAATRELVRKYIKNKHIIPECFGILTVDDWVGSVDCQVQGVSLEEYHCTLKTESDLATLIVDLHSVPIDEAEAILGSERDTVDPWLVPRAHESWNALVSCGYARDTGNLLSDLLERYEPEAIAEEGESDDSLLHGDIKAEHLFVKVSACEDNGVLFGVIDWSDAAIGDIAIDLAGLAISVGQIAVQRIAVKAQVSQPSINRGAKMSMCDAIINLNDRVNGEDIEIPEDFFRIQFRRAFEGTQLEHSLL